MAHMAGVPSSVVSRAQTISKDFFAAFKEKLEARRRSALPLPAHGDFAFLMKVALGPDSNSQGEAQGQTVVRGPRKASLAEQLDMIRSCIGQYEVA